MSGPRCPLRRPHFAAYCERYIHHTKGRWAGRPLIHEPRQREFWWEALEAAGAGAFDVLVVARSDRWQRNLRQTLNLLEDDLHAVGVVVWFDDEQLLSSCERSWDQLVDEAKGAESWLRKHRRRVREGYAAKRATPRDPGRGPRPPAGARALRR